MLPVLDIEEHGGLTVPQLTDWVRTWLARVYARTGVRAMIYASPHFWRTYLGDTTWFADHGYPLWIRALGRPVADDSRGRTGVGTGGRSGNGPRRERVRGSPPTSIAIDSTAPVSCAGKIASLTVTPAAGGVITGARIACGGAAIACTRLANPDTVLTLAATPDPGASFLRWTGACAAGLHPDVRRDRPRHQDGLGRVQLSGERRAAGDRERDGLVRTGRDRLRRRRARRRSRSAPRWTSRPTRIPRRRSPAGAADAEASIRSATVTVPRRSRSSRRSTPWSASSKTAPAPPSAGAGVPRRRDRRLLPLGAPVGCRCDVRLLRRDGDAVHGLGTGDGQGSDLDRRNAREHVRRLRAPPGHRREAPFAQLGAGPHTLAVEVLGTRRPAASGTRVGDRCPPMGRRDPPRAPRRPRRGRRRRTRPRAAAATRSATRVTRSRGCASRARVRRSAPSVVRRWVVRRCGWTVRSCVSWISTPRLKSFATVPTRGWAGRRVAHRADRRAGHAPGRQLGERRRYRPLAGGVDDQSPSGSISSVRQAGGASSFEA